MESRRLTHELVSRGQAIWLSPKDDETLPFPFWSVWAETNAAPIGWDYASECARWDRIPPPPLDLGRYVRFVNIRRSAAQGEAPPSGAAQHPNRAAPAPVPAAVTQPPAEPPSPAPGTFAPQEAPAQGRRRRQPTPQPTSLISYVAPRRSKRGTPEPGRQSSTASQPPLPYPTPTPGRREPIGADGDQPPDMHTTDTAFDRDCDDAPN